MMPKMLMPTALADVDVVEPVVQAAGFLEPRHHADVIVGPHDLIAREAA